MSASRVTLRPEAHFSGDRRPTPDEVVAVHHGSHEECFIARSVQTDVRREPIGIRV